MIIDAHVHVGKSIFGHELSPESLINGMQENGIDKSIICPVQPYDYHLGPENTYISELVKKHEGKFIGFCRVDPRQRDKAVTEVHRAVTELGLTGVFLHPWEEGYRINSDFVVPVARAAAELKVPVMIATGYPWVSHPLQVADLANEVQDGTFLMTNGGQINISGLAQADAYQALDRNEQIYVLTSGVYRQDFLENVIARHGAHRVLFGSQAPRMHQAFELDRAKSATKNNSSAQATVLGTGIADVLHLTT